MQLSYTMLALLTLTAIPVLANSQNQFNSPNELVCNGQRIEMTCYIEPPTSEGFYLFFTPYISFNNSKPYDQDAIDSNSIPGIDTSRYSIEYLGVELPRLACTIVISSYLPQDAATLFGCHGEYFNGTDTAALSSGYAPQPVKPPNKVSKLVTYVNSVKYYYCLAEVHVSFETPYSSSPITNYNLYVNGEFDQKIDATSSQSTVLFNVSPGTTYKLSVTADNCGGTSEMSDDSTIWVPSYSLDNKLDFYLDYFNYLVIEWSLTETYFSFTSIPISYNLKVDTAFTYEEGSNILNQSLNFEQSSSKSSYSFNLGLSIIGEKEITLDTTVKLTISSQCDDKRFAGNSITARKTGIKSHVSIINIPYNISWVVIAALIIVSALCTLSTIVMVLCTLNEHSKKRSLQRRTAYLSFVPQERSEAQEPLLNPPCYAVNTGGRPL